MDHDQRALDALRGDVWAYRRLVVTSLDALAVALRTVAARDAQIAALRDELRRITRQVVSR